MPQFWASALFGRVATTSRSLTIAGTVSIPIFHRFFTQIREKWLENNSNELLCQYVHDTVQIPDLDESSPPDDSVNFYPFYAYLISYDLYSITHIPFYKSECEKYHGQLPVYRICVDYLKHFYILSSQLRGTSSLQSPSDYLCALFAANMGVLLDSQRAIDVISTFPLETAVTFYSAMKDRAPNRRDVIESFYRSILSYISGRLGCQLDSDALLDKLQNAEEWKRYEKLLALMDMTNMSDQTVIRAGLLGLQGLHGSGVLPIIRRLSLANARGRESEREVNALKEANRKLEEELKTLKAARAVAPRPVPIDWRPILTDEQQNIFTFFAEKGFRVTVDGNFGDVDCQRRLPHLINDKYEWPSNEYYWSQDANFSYVLFDFGENYRVTVKRYTLRSTNQRKGAAHPRSWALQGSDVCEEGKWENLSECRGRSELNGAKRTYRGEIPNTKEFRFIRLKQLDQNYQKKLTLSFANIALYGHVKSSDPADWTS